MFMEERLDEIIEILKKDKKVLVKDLSEKFNVSDGMIRKDLQKLEKGGYIKRTYGGAILDRKIFHNENTTSRVLVDLNSKEYIGTIVRNLIDENDVIFLDISSTNYSIATMIQDINKNITLITNMNRIALLFDCNPLVDVIFIGGEYNKKLGGTVGSTSIDMIKNFRIDKSFIGVGGINVGDNFISNFSLEEANTKRAIINSSKKVYLVMDNEKFYRDGSYKFSTLDHIDCIITQEKPEDDLIENLKKYNVELIY